MGKWVFGKTRIGNGMTEEGLPGQGPLWQQVWHEAARLADLLEEALQHRSYASDQYDYEKRVRAALDDLREKPQTVREQMESDPRGWWDTDCRLADAVDALTEKLEAHLADQV